MGHEQHATKPEDQAGREEGSPTGREEAETDKPSESRGSLISIIESFIEFLHETPLDERDETWLQRYIDSVIHLRIVERILGS